VVEAIAGLTEEGQALDDRAILDRLSPEAVEFAVSAQESVELSRPELAEGRLRAAAQALSLLRIPEQVAQIDRQLREAESQGDEDRFVALQKERDGLEKLRQHLRTQGRIGGRGRGAAGQSGEETSQNAQF
jgi:hypothetical protein